MNSSDIKSWISAKEQFSKIHMFSYKRPPVKNFLLVSKSLDLSAHAKHATVLSPEVVSIRFIFKVEDIPNEECGTFCQL